jgi:hypothetical protein
VKTLLVQPPPPPDYVGFRRTAVPEPLALECIAAVVRPAHEVRILDMRFDCRLQEVLAEYQPDVVGVTCLTTEVYSAQALLKDVKALRPQTFTVAGGLHASLPSSSARARSPSRSCSTPSPGPARRATTWPRCRASCGVATARNGSPTRTAR